MFLFYFRFGMFVAYVAGIVVIVACGMAFGAGSICAVMVDREGVIEVSRFPFSRKVTDRALAGIMILGAIRRVAAEAICSLSCSVVESCRQPCVRGMAGRTLAQIMIFRTVFLMAGAAVLREWSFVVEIHLTPGGGHVA